MIGVVYGVKARDMEIAKAWIETLTSLTAVGRNGLHNGGDYYSFERDGAFELLDEEQLKIVNNLDIEDNEPRLLEHPEYPFIVYLDVKSETSPELLALESVPDRFVKLSWDEY